MRHNLPRRTTANSLFPDPPQIFFLAKVTSGARPLDIFLASIPLRGASALVHLWLVYSLLPGEGAPAWTASTIPSSIFAIIFCVSNVHGAFQSASFMAQMSFFTRVAKVNEVYGGSVMTLLNTLANIGSLWPGPLVLLAIDWFSAKACIAPGDPDTSQSCQGCEAPRTCGATRDGYWPVSLMCFAYLVIWYFVGGAAAVRRVQNLPEKSWTSK